MLWTEFWAKDDPGIGKEEVFIKLRCPVTKCEITTNRSRINESDYVVTDFAFGVDERPKFWPANQRWIFNAFESPYLMRKDYSNLMVFLT